MPDQLWKRAESDLCLRLPGAPPDPLVWEHSARVAKLAEMRDAIDSRLANPILYARADPGEMATLRKKRAEVEEGIERAEALWMAALGRLEAACEPG